MKKRDIIYFIIVIFCAMVWADCAICQEAEPPAQEIKEEAPAIPSAAEISIYGEVQAVNTSDNTLSVQYYDYDSDEEKTAEVVLSKDTKIENANTLNDIKQGDWVDATYTVVEGKNLAKSITVEKEEPISESEAPLEESAPVPSLPAKE